MIINNKLTNTDIHAYIKIDNSDTIGAGELDNNTRKRKTLIRANGGKLEVDFPTLPINSLKLYVELEQMPEKDGIEGVKIIPGKASGIVHHFEFYEVEHEGELKIYGLVHFDLTDKKDKKIIKHIDPNVDHPDT